MEVFCRFSLVFSMLLMIFNSFTNYLIALYTHVFSLSFSLPPSLLPFLCKMGIQNTLHFKKSIPTLMSMVRIALQLNKVITQHFGSQLANFKPTEFECSD